jgi:hypothetical protein
MAISQINFATIDGIKPVPNKGHLQLKTSYGLPGKPKTNEMIVDGEPILSVGFIKTSDGLDFPQFTASLNFRDVQYS